ncbi:hypothetical protein Tco_1319929 [Tanacetum coccineum]
MGFVNKKGLLWGRCGLYCIRSRGESGVENGLITVVEYIIGDGQGRKWVGVGRLELFIIGERGQPARRKEVEAYPTLVNFTDLFYHDRKNDSWRLSHSERDCLILRLLMVIEIGVIG